VRRAVAVCVDTALRLVGVLLLAGCATPLRSYEGLYQRGFEQSTMRPCQSTSPERSWWIVMGPEPDSVAAAAVARHPTELLYARFRGRVSEPGAYGHLGASSRMLRVERVDEIRPHREGDCVPARPFGVGG
jgi:hypothetical protein